MGKCIRNILPLKGTFAPLAPIRRQFFLFAFYEIVLPRNAHHKVLPLQPFASFIPNTRRLTTTQKSDTSESEAESFLPISIASIPATYKFLYGLFVFGSISGGSTTSNGEFEFSLTSKYSLPLPLEGSHNRVNFFGFVYDFCTFI